MRTHWIRRLFSAESAEDDATEREEYGSPERPESEPERSFFAGYEASEAAEEELDEFKPPADPAP